MEQYFNSMKREPKEPHESYRQAQERFKELQKEGAGSKNFEEFKLLSEFLGCYSDEHFPINFPDLVD